MCLRLKDDEFVHLAKKDIVCYKQVTKTQDGKWKGFYVGRRSYDFDKVVTAEKRTKNYEYEEIKGLKVEKYEISGREDMYFIDYGFHALVQKRFPSLRGFNYCIIPAGTEMCYGQCGDVVAVNMIVFKNVFHYIKYRIKNHKK